MGELSSIFSSPHFHMYGFHRRKLQTSLSEQILGLAYTEGNNAGRMASSNDTHTRLSRWARIQSGEVIIFFRIGRNLLTKQRVPSLWIELQELQIVLLKFQVKVPRLSTRHLSFQNGNRDTKLDCWILRLILFPYNTEDILRKILTLSSDAVNVLKWMLTK